jgi:hypothetical protein
MSPFLWDSVAVGMEPYTHPANHPKTFSDTA